MFYCLRMTVVSGLGRVARTVRVSAAPGLSRGSKRAGRTTCGPTCTTSSSTSIRPTWPFYRDLLATLGWQTLYDDQGMLGVGGPHGESLWFLGVANGARNDYDGAGLNHLALGAGAQADVDTAADYLRGRSVELLFETPRHRPEFSGGSGDQTYYQVMFESPDRILLEVVYTGPKVA